MRVHHGPPTPRLVAGVLLAALLVGGALREPLLRALPFADDYDHFAMLHGDYPAPRHPLDLYRFVGGAADDRAALMEQGRLPWWTHETIRLAMLRPLSSALLALDYRLFADDPLAIHLHSLLWWALAVCAVGALFFALMPRVAAASATFLYAIEEAHTFPLGWVANRHALIATALAAAALYRHIRARRSGAKTTPASAIVLAALALLAGEYAFATFAYLAAFELFETGPRAQRLRALAPYSALAVCYLAVRQALGYGLAGSAFYISPLSAPLDFAAAMLRRIPLLATDLGLSLPAEWSQGVGTASFWPGAPAPLARAVVDNAHAIQLTLGALCLLSLCLLAAGFPRPRAHDAAGAVESEARAQRFLLAGALLSLLPVAGTLAMPRLLLAAAIGMHGYLGCVVLDAARRLRSGSPLRRAHAGVVLASVLALHALHAGRRALSDARYLEARARAEFSFALTAELATQDLTELRLFVIAAQDWLSASALPFAYARALGRAPRSHHLLSAAAQSPHELHRTADDTLEITVLAPRAHAFVDTVYRDAASPFAQGDRITLSAFEVTVLSVQDGQPTRFRIRFARSLDDPRYRFLFPTAAGLRRVHPPPVGYRVRLPRASFPGLGP